MRKRDAPLKVMRVRGTNKVRRVQDFRPLRVKAQIVSDELLAFQFYDSEEPPPIPEPVTFAVPKKRRVRLHQPVTRRTYEKVGV
jgi:hypothetical protein